MSQAKTELTNAFNKAINSLERNTNGTQIGCYSVALVGLTIALRTIRPFSRFKRPSDIPDRFVKERRELVGHVQRIEPTGTLLMVQHKPLVAIPGLRSDKTLPVKISGIKISGLGGTWLHSVAAGQKITFIPVFKDKNFVHCEVTMPQVVSKKKINHINLGESLLKIGFAQLEPISRPLKDDKAFSTYYYRLKVAEAYALKKQMGLKYYIKPTISTVLTLSQKLMENVFKPTIKYVKNVPKLTAI